jgi:uncharacterized membrane protein YqjE
VSEARDLRAELSEIGTDLGDLLKTEMELARAETREQVQNLTRLAIWGAVALVTSIVLVVWIALTATYALSEAMDDWLAALIVTVVLGLIVGTAAMLAKARLGQVSIMPKRTVNAVKEDMQWAKQQLKSSSNSSASATP